MVYIPEIQNQIFITTGITKFPVYSMEFCIGNIEISDKYFMIISENLKILIQNTKFFEKMDIITHYF